MAIDNIEPFIREFDEIFDLTPTEEKKLLHLEGEPPGVLDCRNSFP